MRVRDSVPGRSFHAASSGDGIFKRCLWRASASSWKRGRHGGGACHWKKSNTCHSNQKRGRRAFKIGMAENGRWRRQSADASAEEARMNPETPFLSETTAYDWYADRYQSVFVSRNRWLVTAIIALALAFFQALALLCLVPLKTAVPFVIKEEVSGAITTVAPLRGDSAITYQEAVRKYFLVGYVIHRETYDPADLADNYKAVTLMSAADQRQAFERTISKSNPRSPLVIYGTRSKRWVRIKSISFLNDHLAQVRFTATEKSGSTADAESEWTAIISLIRSAFMSPAIELTRRLCHESKPLENCVHRVRARRSPPCGDRAPTNRHGRPRPNAHLQRKSGLQDHRLLRLPD